MLVFIYDSASAIMVYDECRLRVVKNVIMKMYIAHSTRRCELGKVHCLFVNSLRTSQFI